MLRIQKATEEDFQKIQSILNELDLDHMNQDLDKFVVAADKQKIIGIAEISEYENFSFIYSFGIIKELQSKGYGKDFLSKLLKQLKKPVYLYTIIPEFFLKNGFVLTEFIEGLPPRSTEFCSNCEPDKCAILKFN